MTKLPRWVDVTHYQRGDVLWHGTSMAYGITDLQRPAWVSNSHAVASWFSRWKLDTKSEMARVMKYVVVQPFTLPTFDARLGVRMPGAGTSNMDFSTWLARLLDDDLDFIHDLYGRADEVCRAGLPGWRIVNNYDSGDDILLCHPDRLLRRVQAGAARKPRS